MHWLQGIAAEPARAGVHGGHQHEASRIGERREGAGDRDVAVLQRLPQHLEHVALELRQLIEEEHAVVRQAHLARPGDLAAADQARVGDGVVRRAERPRWR